MGKEEGSRAAEAGGTPALQQGSAAEALAGRGGAGGRAPLHVPLAGQPCAGAAARLRFG